jgi:hypothetical protein
MGESSAARGSALSRRAALRGAAAVGAAVATGLGAAGRTPTAGAHNLQPAEFEAAYEQAVGRSALHYQVYQFPNIQNPIIWSNIRNGLNGSQFSFGEPAGSLAVVVQCYATGNLATYNDAMWDKYQFGALFNVRDPSTGESATRNLFYPRTTTGGTDLAPEDAQSLYNDTGMAGLMERGVVFLT